MTSCSRRRAIGLVFLLAATGWDTAFAQGGGPVVGVLGIPTEIAPIELRLQNSVEQVVHGNVFHVGTIDGHRVVVGRSGIGKVNAAMVATLLIDRFAPSALIFSGTAGGLDPDLHPGDLVIGTSVAQHDVGRQMPEGLVRRGSRDAVSGNVNPLLEPASATLLTIVRRVVPGLTLPALRTTEGLRTPRIVEAVIATGDVFLQDPARAAELRRSLGAAAVEMEGGAMMQVCRQFAVPCLVVRSITDRADVQAEASYEQFIAAASQNAATLVTAVISQLGAEAP